LHLVGVERLNFRLVFDVDEDAALFIADCKLRFTVKLDGSKDSSFGGVDDGRIVTSSVQGEDALGSGIVENRIRILSDFDFARSLERFEIEDVHCALTSVAGKAAAELMGEGNAMNSGSIGNVADLLA